MPTRRPVLLRRRRKDRWIGRAESRSLTAHFLDSLETCPAWGPFEEPMIVDPTAPLMCIGDPDVDALQNEYVGDESPGATTPTPDQNLIDETGRAYGVDYSGALRTSSELLDRRDQGRPGLPKDQAGRAL
jgi:Family of unknown function (DUF6335)